MAQPNATLYRMKLPDHECPYGLLALRMLKDSGYDVDDQLLTSRDQVEAFKQEHGIATTPLVYIDGQPIGGSEDLAQFLQSVPQE